jgi:hypothetical protein
MTHQIVASSPPVARKPNKAKAGKPVRMQIIFPGELVELVDGYAEKMTQPFKRVATRTDAMKELVVEALKARGLIK